MFGILDVLVLILVRLRHCSRCDRVFWAPLVHSGEDMGVGRECYVGECGNRYETGRREWTHLSQDEKRKYLWSGLLMIPVVTMALGAIAGYFLKWHEPYWFRSVFVGFLGLLGGPISAVADKRAACYVVTPAYQAQRTDAEWHGFVTSIDKNRECISIANWL